VSGTLVYVYAILGEALNLAISGIDLQPVHWVEHDDLAAAVSDVAEVEFDEEPLNANVQNMGWLGPKALAHQDVNARLFEAAGAIVPLAFGTVFRDDERVRQLLRERGPWLKEQLQRVRGCTEWVVALHLLREADPQEVAAASPKVQSLREQIDASSPGRAHLLRRQLATLERDEARRLQSETATQLIDALRVIAVDVFREPLPTDTVERPLLRASLLVRKNAEAEFLDQIDHLRQRWAEPTYRLLLTGPWPPYRFAGLERDAV
jgi:hypothetical protein